MGALNRLTTAKLRSLQGKTAKPGKYCDGGGLWLVIGEGNAASWVFRYRLNGKSRQMGLGPLWDVDATEARELAAHYRSVKRRGLDPISDRERERREAALQQAATMTFRECAERTLAAKRHEWKNAKHAKQWAATLETYAYPTLGDLPVQRIETAHVYTVLDKIWLKKPETASRLRQRIEAVLAWATVRRFREGDNPARWKGHLKELLPTPAKIKKVRHHPALPYAELPDFIAELRQREGLAARALEFTILTATRTSEALNAKWDEIDLDAAVWTVPAERMKSRREHRVPLSKTAVALLESLPRIKGSPFIFPGAQPRKPMSNMSMLKVLQRMDRGDLTVHGFRSTFRDWCAEQTNYPRELAEASLAHVLTDKTEAAYQRGDKLQKRARMMDAWARYARTTKRGSVTPIGKAARHG